MYRFLDNINEPRDLKKLKQKEIEILSEEIRDFLIEMVSSTGGHLASNLGVVELTLALHQVFDTSKDKLIFDVGHQSYVHKLLTGRKKGFSTLRKFRGMSGFPKKSESKHDCYETGHSSTSISAALGMAIARDMRGENHEVIAVIGDGALTGGLAFEALNHLGSVQTDMLVILNDNEMSICPNVGAISNYLCQIRVGNAYRSTVKKIVDTVGSIPIIGEKTVDAAIEIKNRLKHALVPGAFFDEMGIKYFGPVDGHNSEGLKKALEEMRKIKGPKLLHVLTTKGKGYGYAEENPSFYHGVGPFNKNLGVSQSNNLTYSDVVGFTLKDIFDTDKKSLAITAAMIKGTGLDHVTKKHLNRVVDVGIAEGHGVTFCAGLASSGIKPYFAVYSTFLQRGFDHIVHDVCIQNLPVTFLIDRAGIVGEDGETHQGLLDLSYLIPVPNMTIMAPKDKDELVNMIKFSHKYDSPIAIRYPRGKVAQLNANYPEKDLLRWEVMKDGKSAVILAVGKMVETALFVSQNLEKQGISVKIINSRTIKPLDEEMLQSLSIYYDKIYTIEDNFVTGGFGSIVTNFLSDHQYKGEVKNFGFPDNFIEHGKVDLLYEKYGLSVKGLSQHIFQDIKKSNIYEDIS